MNEAEGCALLKQQFAAAGYDISEHFPFAEQGIHFSVDGFDPVRRVGYEYITTEAGDRTEITPEVVAALEQRMARGELYILLIDECDVAFPAELAHAAEEFLKRVAIEQQARSS